MSVLDIWSQIKAAVGTSFLGQPLNHHIEIAIQTALTPAGLPRGGNVRYFSITNGQYQYLLQQEQFAIMDDSPEASNSFANMLNDNINRFFRDYMTLPEARVREYVEQAVLQPNPLLAQVQPDGWGAPVPPPQPNPWTPYTLVQPNPHNIQVTGNYEIRTSYATTGQSEPPRERATIASDIWRERNGVDSLQSDTMDSGRYSNEPVGSIDELRELAEDNARNPHRAIHKRDRFMDLQDENARIMRELEQVRAENYKLQDELMLLKHRV